MISNTQKLILVIGLAANIAGIATVGTLMHNRYVASHTIELSKVVVTPADAVGGPLASNEAIQLTLAPVVVTPADTEERYAANAARHEDQASDTSAIEVLVQAMDALSPGEYLDSSAAMDVLSTLAFVDAGR
ncbi:MAG TPA: hypothetical protein VFX47_07230 [Gammaproteobacteria bacterium]|nr:hypothetical protein [Gammaproteobacteria bacterium]